MNISYVIPAYNSEPFLRDAVDSIFNGNFLEGDEVIIINDGSTDGTLILARKLGEIYSPHVHIINNPENIGCPASRNKGITLSKNAFIFNLDADNILTPGSIEPLKDALLRNYADVAAFGEYFYFKTVPNSITHKWICKPGIMSLADFFSGMVNPGPGGNFLYRKEIWQKIGGYWEYGKGLHEAWGFSLKLLLSGAKFFVVPNTHYFHRYSHQSLFMRENKNGDESSRVSNLFIKSALPLLTEESRKYVTSTKNWYDKLDQKPLILKDGSTGKNGTVLYNTFSGKLRVIIRAIYGHF